MARKKISKRAKWRLATYGTISVFLIGYFLYVAISSTYYFISLRQQEEELQAELKNLVAEQEYLEREIVRLNDPRYLANFARENYQYSRDGELIIQRHDPEEEVDDIEVERNNYWWYAGGLSFIVITGYLFYKKK